MQRIKPFLAYLILLLTIGFNLVLNFPETKILADPNDNIFQYSLVYRTNWVWENYRCPFSLSCLPSLLDHEVTAWAEGYPLPFYYSHIPQIAIVSSYHLIIKPVSSIFNLPFTLYQYYNWTKYLLLCLFPLSVFLALRIVGFNPVLAALGAFFSAHFSTDGLYGIDPPSFLWRGYGLSSQLYAMIFLPLGLVYAYKALKENNTRSLLLTIVFLTLTTAGHLGIGIIGILSTIPFLFFDLKLKNIWQRVKKLVLIIGILILLLSYWIIPMLLNNNYHIISFWDPIWKFDSYGWYEAVKQFFQGEIFDWQRAPIITYLVLIGFFALLLNSRLFPFALLFAFWFLLYFGRTTWGGLIDLIPGMKDFHQHRFIVGIHMAALFLIPAGLDYLIQIIENAKCKMQSAKLHIKIQNFITLDFKAGDASEGIPQMASPKEERATRRLWRETNSNRERFEDSGGRRERQDPQINIFQNIIFYIVILTCISIFAYFTAKKTYEYALLNNKWIDQANNAFLYDEKNFQDLVSYLKLKPSARLYAGRPGNWGKSFRLGSTELYMLFGVYGFDVSQFLPETWSPMSENEQNFDERAAEDYDLLNIRYVVSDKNHEFTPEANLTNKSGPFELYEVPTNGWFDIVTSPMFVKSDKTSFINLVQLWHRSYPRRWKMHPLISVEKKPVIPQGTQKVLTMVDEVTYQVIPSEVEGSSERSERKNLNIFADFPFVFPEATISGKILKENVDKQSYSATIDIPPECKQCMAMFKMSYHPNWRVFVDGKRATKYAVFPFYLATPLSSGTHVVEFTYQPNRLKVFLLAGEILFLILFLFRKKIKLLP